MKSFFNIIIFFSISITLFSCASSQTFYVNGTPGTIITTPSNERIAQIDNSGQAKITLKRNIGYYPFLEAQTPYSNIKVPFALDYKNKNRNLPKYVLLGSGYSLVYLGCTTVAGCLIGYVASGEEFFMTIMSVASLASGAGAGLGIWGDSMEQLDRNYDYLENQSINNDIIQ